jgi:hypothetical protein
MFREAASPSPCARVPVPSGRCYRITGTSERVRPALAAQLQLVLERFAAEAGASAERPISVELRPGVVGHHRVGRATDLYGVAGTGLDAWKRRWDAALGAAGRLEASDRDGARAVLARERSRNLGWRLYRALQCHARWAQPYGYPVQLFGPWTREAGPWRFISDRLLRAHRDHIHVAL